MSSDALAKAMEAAPGLLDQAVLLGRIECGFALLVAVILGGCGAYGFFRSRQLEGENKAVAQGLAAICALGVVLLALIAGEGLLQSVLAPKAYAIQQLIGSPL